mmetsp:Transcript_25399/g.53113  ORF Transcript_25399/g.53113 Transcript_25399/m.53113 type:complete len:443 (-) Transcript_25399:2-1330(-)
MMAESSRSITYSPAEATDAARKLWLAATSQSDLDEVERLYRWALSSKTQQKQKHSPNTNRDENEEEIKNDNNDEPPKKKIKSGDCGLNRTQFTQAGEKLALLLCQSGRCKKAKKGLASMGFTCRLAEQVLDYPCEGDDDSSENDDDSASSNNKIKEKRKSLCQIVDGFLSQTELERLRMVFGSPTASYWNDHNYAVEPPSPYFSYVIPLEEVRPTEENEMKRFGFIGHLVQKMMSCPLLNENFPKLQSKANFVELWAHNRPHASGHQMHFDSDDEGRGGIRNPIISTIIYITAEGATKKVNATGGPSLVTNQKLSDIRLASKGWMAHPKQKRLVAFDGRYLHGVVPGKGFQQGRRVTLMLAFWENIKIREGHGPGSARPFPDNNLPEWAQHLVAPFDEDGDNYGSCVETAPVKLDRIYETLDGKARKRGTGMPTYDEVFQGF